MKMRIITDQEYDLLMDVTRQKDALSHWKDMLSWVNDTDNRYRMSASHRAARGYRSPRFWHHYHAGSQGVNVGFRPAFDMDADSLPTDTQDGDTVVIGTLYMDGVPVRVPKMPTAEGDIEDYIPGAELEMWSALEDPAYQVKAIKLHDGVFAADRNLLKNVSYMVISKFTKST